MKDTEIAIVGGMVIWLLTSLFVGRTAGFVLTFSATVFMLGMGKLAYQSEFHNLASQIEELNKEKEKFSDLEVKIKNTKFDFNDFLKEQREKYITP